MAYSNWGAEVYVDGEPRHENCDATPLQVLRQEERYRHYLEHYILKPWKEGEKRDPLAEMYHAVVGDAKSGLLVAIRKSYPSHLWTLTNEGEAIQECPLPTDDLYNDWYDSEGFMLPVGDTEVELWPSQEPECAHCQFVDVIGRIWVAISGYLIGEGHQPWGLDLQKGGR